MLLNGLSRIKERKKGRTGEKERGRSKRSGDSAIAEMGERECNQIIEL
jgi:hypothetical protein